MDLKKAKEILKQDSAKMFKSEFTTAVNVVLMELENRARLIEIKDRYFEMISLIGCDYDGCESPKHLKELIDELINYADLGLEADETEVMFVSGDNKFNILHERLGINDDEQ